MSYCYCSLLRSPLTYARTGQNRDTSKTSNRFSAVDKEMSYHATVAARVLHLYSIMSGSTDKQDLFQENQSLRQENQELRSEIEHLTQEQLHLRHVINKLVGMIKRYA